jgi:4-hydroxy-tetrahydrodipicolinate synthase
MQNSHAIPQGIWLPLVTPFSDGALDEPSFRRIVRHYAGEPVDGFIVAATTGESLTLDDAEQERLAHLIAEELAAIGRSVPVYFGVSGSDTRKGVKTLSRMASWPVDGYLIVSPYYTRPSQDGLYQHFLALAEVSTRPILIYNIPYRTGVNLGNDTMLRLAEHPNVVGTKECCADAVQSSELLRHRPAGFSVLTGEDALFYTALAQGADGGVLGAAHVGASRFAAVRHRLASGDMAGALALWHQLCDLPRLLFQEPSPAPIKYWLHRIGLIDSGELRLPMTPVSEALAARIEAEIARGRWG